MEQLLRIYGKLCIMLVLLYIYFIIFTELQQVAFVLIQMFLMLTCVSTCGNMNYDDCEEVSMNSSK